MHLPDKSSQGPISQKKYTYILNHTFHLYVACEIYIYNIIYIYIFDFLWMFLFHSLLVGLLTDGFLTTLNLCQH